MTSYLALVNGRMANQTFPYDLVLFFPGNPGPSALLLSNPMVRAISFAVNFAGSQATCGTSPTNATAIEILKNGVSVGLLSFAAGATVGVFTGAAVTFVIGDILSFRASATYDPTFADIGPTMTGTR
ncbi:MAG: hypothetical protein PHT60_16275 [Acidiphilium sp.]|nr:hypothetical protein [Gallionella sp.]MDD4937321.1 hypothetical protein [Acidiphilium sp.]